MRLSFSILLLLSTAMLCAQSPYPIIAEDCYVKLKEGLLKNLDHANYLKVSFWGLDYRRNPDNEHISYLKHGEHRKAIDSIFRARIRQLVDQFGEELVCKRLRLPEKGFKQSIRNRYGPNPTFTFQIKLQLYCDDIKYLHQPNQTLFFRYYLDSTGVFVEDRNISPATNHFSRCKRYHVDEVFLRHQARDSLGILNPFQLRLTRLDSVNYTVYKSNRIGNDFKSYRYNIVDSTFYNDLPPPNNRHRFRKRPVDLVSGKFISSESVGAWELYKFAVDAQYHGNEVDSSVITVAHLETTHSYRPGRLGKRALVRISKQDDWLLLTAADSINNFYTMAGSAVEIGYAFPELEKTLHEQYDSTKTIIFDPSLCDELKNESFNLRFNRPRFQGDGTMAIHLWAFTKHKRKSLVGPLELVLQYDTTLVGGSLVSRGRLKVTTTYSFSSIGSKRLYSKSFADTIPVEVVDVAHDKIKVSINGPSDLSWFDLMPIRKGQVNPNVYGPLFRLEVKTDSICNSTASTHLFIDTTHLDSTIINYIDYLCDEGHNQHAFQEKRAINEVTLRMDHIPYQFFSISTNKFQRGDTITIYGTFLNTPNLDIRMRCYGSDGLFNFTRILSVPQEYIIKQRCESVTLIVPEEIPFRKSGFPEKLHPISGLLRAKHSSEGLEYAIEQ
ncbi:MAG: hypothetical protein AAFN81_25370 [Bacteroidota bacterium]